MTWQSFNFKKASVFEGPCIPHPTTPSVTRSEGAAWAPRPSALAGMIVGAATANPVAAIKRRRLMPDLAEGFFIFLITPDFLCQRENKIND
jgi:hypothetical protein